jgi:hypothetical protein
MSREPKWRGLAPTVVPALPGYERVEFCENDAGEPSLSYEPIVAWIVRPQIFGELADEDAEFGLANLTPVGCSGFSIHNLRDYTIKAPNGRFYWWDGDADDERAMLAQFRAWKKSNASESAR